MSVIKYQPHIDGLRAIAVTWVVLFHGFPQIIPGGFVGVDIFFVISGYLITRILLQDLESYKFSLLDFYARRIRRIFPALLFIFIFAFALGWFVLLADEFKVLGKHIFGGATFLSNWILWLESGYFDHASELKPLLHLWSLGIEEQFYLIWPLFLYLLWKFHLNIARSIVVVIVISFAISLVILHIDPVGAFYLPFSRFWELAAGGWLASFSGNNFTKNHRFQSSTVLILTVFALGFLVLPIFTLDSRSFFPGFFALLPVVGAMLVIAIGNYSNFIHVILSNRLLVALGLISYPLYLWHWVILSFARIINGKALEPFWVWLLITISIMFSFLTYYLLERKIRYLGKKTTIALILLMIAIGFTGWNIYKREGLDFRYKKIIHLPQNFQRDFTKWEDKGMQPEGDCNPAFLFPKRHICLNGGVGKIADTVVIGDSHAYSAYWGVKEHFGRSGHIVQLIGKGACVPFKNLKLSRVGPECLPVINAQLDWIISNKAIKNIFISHRYAYLQTNASQEDIDNFKKSLKETLLLLSKDERKIIYLLSLPELRFDPRYCIGDLPLGRKKPKENCDYSLNEEIERQSLYRSTLLEVVKDFPSVQIYDPSDFMCKNGTCNPVIKNQMMLMDDNHFSESGSLMQGQDMFKKIQLHK